MLKSLQALTLEPLVPDAVTVGAFLDDAVATDRGPARPLLGTVTG